MVDLNYLKRTYSGSVTKELTDIYLLKTEGLIPESIFVIKEELESRGVDIEAMYQDEILKSGSTEYLINNALDINSKNELKICGDLYLTSKGIYFIPIRSQNPGLVMYFGILGSAVDQIRSKLSAEGSTTVKNRKNVPVSLLAKYINDSHTEYINDLDSIIYGRTGGIRTVNKNRGIQEYGFFDEENVFKVENWINTHGIRHEISERCFGRIYLT
jgi:hypothetical protein